MLCERPNGLHRADVAKMLVHPEARGRGIAKALLAALDARAAALGRWLLVLDTRRGDVAEGLYPKVGYRRVGVIPCFAEAVAGGFEDTVYFYKLLPGHACVGEAY